ncbi:F0F1 ATP synthase subunit epsilon [Limnochorda pilosa]|uniref:ATP synthase epsilon chain n=1 Tax=Limnochorda pilosa TaxID=1555112 RepID=A0A0K2SQ00_LIMPI|nr:F0F1 ATP synthase subunit epsilon [Limnochorda pilosa]BAS28914.1 F0F1 ATP synthase subunit epsilon [Limnochorda pilosa]
MDRLLRVEVVTAERRVLQERAESVILPAANGYLGVLPGHAPLIAGLSVGVLQFGGYHAEKRRVAVSGGFAEVADDRVTVLADTAELAEEIDVERARRAAERAERRLRERQAHVDHHRAEMALRRAINRIKAAGGRM